MRRPLVLATALTAVLAVVLAVALATAGCSGTPKAPALTDDAVFRDDATGLSFVVPEGWIMSLRSTPPPGRLEKPLQLVRYQPSNLGRAADLEVYCADLPADTDLHKYLDEHPIGGEKWSPGPPRPVSVGGIPGNRFEYLVHGKRLKERREVTAARRGDRVFFFMTTYGVNDAPARDQTRVAVEGVSWK